MEEEAPPVTCLDTSVLIDAMRNEPKARRAVEAASESGIATTEVNVYELYVGAHRDGRPVEPEIRGIGRSLTEIEVLPFVRPASVRAAALTSLLRSRGQEVGTLDVLIAAITLVHGITRILTRNVADFRRIPGLRVDSY
jgi:predicted nucleic acid-binding protein